MTNTISVPRDLLIDVRDSTNEAGNLSYRQHHIDHHRRLTRKLDELLEAPAVEIEGLEVVAWQDAENQLYTTGEKRQMHGWATDGYPIVELVHLSDATAVIDQLRERVVELERLAEAISNDCNTVANERNDLRAALKEQEPVAWVDRDGSGHDVNWYKADIDRLPDGTKLYASPVAQQKVVMPERKELSIYADEEFHRWLEQLPDEAARLNRSKT